MYGASAFFGGAWETKKEIFLHMLKEEFPASQDFLASLFEKAGFQVLERWNKTSFYGGLLARKAS